MNHFKLGLLFLFLLILLGCETKQSNKKFTCTFYAADGSIYETIRYDKGEEILAPVGVWKKGTPEFEYEFLRWEGFYEGMLAVQDYKFYPVYQSMRRLYPYVFYDEDGFTILAEGSLGYKDKIPLPNEPVKSDTEVFHFEFVGWSGYSDDMEITGPVFFIAQYSSERRTYQYSFESEEEIYSQGKLFYCDIIPTPPTPVKSDTEDYSYTFVGWFPEFKEGMLLTEDVTFVAQFLAVSKSIPLSTLEELYQDLEMLAVDEFGSAVGELVKFQAQCIARLDEERYLFYDGTRVLTLTADEDELIFVVGEHYEIEARLAKKQYKPEVNLVRLVSLDVSTPIEFLATQPITSHELGGKDHKDTSYYSRVYSFHGFVDADVRNHAQIKYILVDQLGDTVIGDDEDSSFALFVANSTDTVLSDLLYPFYYNEQEVELCFTLVQHNESYKAWTVFVFASTIRSMMEE